MKAWPRWIGPSCWRTVFHRTTFHRPTIDIAGHSASEVRTALVFLLYRRGGGFHGGRGGFRGGFHGGRGGFHGGRGGFRGGGRGGGRRSDFRLKHEIILLGHLNNGLGFYRFVYNGGEKAYVGVIAQEVQKVIPQAVVRDRDGYLRVFYNKVGLKFQTFDQWIASGARVPPLP